MRDFARLELGYVFFRSICTRIIFKALLDASGGGRPPVYGPENKKQTDCEPCIYRQYVCFVQGMLLQCFCLHKYQRQRILSEADKSKRI